MKVLFSRADTVIRLIEIRKMIKENENNQDEIPEEYHNKLKEELDRLLLDVIGVPKEGQHKINEILDKAIKGEIKARTATVAVHEIFLDYQEDGADNSSGKIKKNNKNNDNRKPGNNEIGIDTNKTQAPDMEELYNSGYR